MWQCSARIHTVSSWIKPIICPTGCINEMAILNYVVRKDSFFSFLFSSVIFNTLTSV